MPAPSAVSACSCVQTVLAKQCAVRLSWRFTSPAIIRSGGMASALTSRCERGLPVSPARPRATFCRKMCLPTEAEIWANVAMARNSRSPSFRPHAQSCGSVDQFGFGSWRSWSDRVNAVANGLDRVLCDCGGLLPLVHQDDPRSVPRRSSRAHPACTSMVANSISITPALSGDGAGTIDGSGAIATSLNAAGICARSHSCWRQRNNWLV